MAEGGVTILRSNVTHEVVAVVTASNHLLGNAETNSVITALQSCEAVLIELLEGISLHILNNRYVRWSQSCMVFSHFGKVLLVEEKLSHAPKKGIAA